MGSFCRLQIDCNYKTKELLTQFLGESNHKNPNIWDRIIDENEKNSVAALYDFVGIINENKDQLSEIGIVSDDISVWNYYEYEGQCNMEFEPKIMKELGDLGVVLCISCWEASQ
ncbi:hypothetical protein LAG90_05250 [Marinilongibacter aquaticus]|uniref:hypothetical protein n=1 Tax=Marinilongibacter aquaticus TaxID=2975157 RepID=UPI0021BCFC03|nr:hypothetical protein [Marinilongibacter aquaticus]UBM60051.1 hypothetical protein LAG90_05250 [Marinilongibacter aquaticus]